MELQFKKKKSMPIETWYVGNISLGMEGFVTTFICFLAL